MSLVTHYKPSLLCLKLKHHQVFHSSCQAAHLPYISLIGGPVPHRMDTCACTGQQPCTFAGNVGPPGSEDLMCVHSRLSDQQHTQTGPSSRYRAKTMSDSTAQQNCNMQKHRAAAWFIQSKTHTNTH